MALPNPDADADGRTAVSVTELLEVLATLTDPYDVRRVWSRALEAASSVEDRDRVLVAVADRLPHLVIPPEKGRSGTDRLWLRQVAREAVLRGGDVSNELAAASQKVLREAVFTAEAEIREWMTEEQLGTSVLDFMRRSPRAAAALRELGRLVYQLRVAGATALIERDLVQALISFHEALLAVPVAPTDAVGEWLRVTSHELRQWADSPDAKHLLPILVRRLILETGIGVTSVHFPAGTAVTAGGWDGLVTTEGASLYVPGGRSGWELSTEEPANAKATKDFNNRVTSVPVEERSTMTFVELISRPWTKAADFRSAAMARSEFADVRAYNVEDLAAWLEHAPSTSIWFKELIEKPVAGLRSIGSVWQTWLKSTSVPLDENVVLAGRGDAAAEVGARARSGAGVTTVGGDVRLEEILAFLGAVAQLPSEDADAMQRLVVIEDEATTRRVFATAAPMLVLLTSPALAAALPPSSKHHCLIAAPGGERVDVSIPRVDASGVGNYFRKLGVDFYVAADRGELARRSLLALRRELAIQPELYRPTWAVPPASQDLRRVLLLNAWNGRRDADRSAVERLLAIPYDEVEERLRSLARTPDDPFVANFDDDWHVVSGTDSWLLLASQLSRSDVETFSEIAVEVLTDVDPVSTLPDDERWRASLQGVRPSYSPRLRRGLARSLALLGVIGSSADVGAGWSAGQIARGVISRILARANADSTFNTWTSVSPYLSLLTEAAPQEVVEGLRAGMFSDPPLMRLMFQDAEDSMLGPPSSPHVQFLWALEALAWSADHLTEAVDLLADLAEIDPGGRWSNRPLSSLKSILCAWHPGTAATTGQQIQVVERLTKAHPDVAWEVLLSLLPTANPSVVLHRGPEFRSWKQGEPRVPADEYWQIVEASARLLLRIAGVDVSRWAALIGEIDNIPEDLQPDFLASLTELASRLDDDRDRRVVWDALRGFIARHREYADAKWAVSEQLLTMLDPVCVLLEPQDARLKFGWLFAGGMIELGDLRRRDDLAEYDAELDRRRRDAVGRIFEAGGLDAVLSFGEDVAMPGQVGLALARYVTDADSASQLFACLDGESEAASSVAFAYFGERFREHGWEYVERLLDSGSPRASARLLRSSWQPIEASARADALGDQVAQEFWREFSYFGLGSDFGAVLEIARRLREAGRSAASLDFLAMYSRGTDSPELAEAIALGLERLMESPDDPEIRGLREYNFDVLMKVLAKHRDELGRGRVVTLEWFFLPMLGFSPDAHNLHRTLAEDPGFFVQMITLMYRRANQRADDEIEVDENQRRAAENAFRLLHSWRMCPGTDESGTLQNEALHSWVAKARELLAEADRVSVGDDEIGQALVAAPGDDLGWPPRVVRDLIEEIRSEDLDRGFGRRIFNNRGVTSRSLDAGGRQEWDLAAKYRAVADDARTAWRRVARIFDGLVETYEAAARREDASAERRRRGLE